MVLAVAAASDVVSDAEGSVGGLQLSSVRSNIESPSDRVGGGGDARGLVAAECSKHPEPRSEKQRDYKADLDHGQICECQIKPQMDTHGKMRTKWTRTVPAKFE